jgi:diadenosine tetraphosphatase ApaH/serine/threonine PP2A family protein phosphatase
MRYSIFSDIHSNLEAYQAALKVMAPERIDRYICLGDIVGYGANPKECIELTRELVEKRGCLCIAGNHDAAVAEMTPLTSFNTFARLAVIWTRKVIDPADSNFLSLLPLLKSEDGLVFVHSSPNTPQEWRYIYTLDEAYNNFEILREKICFIGHSHIPVVFKADNHFEYFVSSSFKIEAGFRYIVNIGSIGQPRDRDPRASFVIYDTEERSIEYKRVEYDIAKAQAKIIQAGLPQILAARLGVGE